MVTNSFLQVLQEENLWESAKSVASLCAWRGDRLGLMLIYSFGFRARGARRVRATGAADFGARGAPFRTA